MNEIVVAKVAGVVINPASIDFDDQAVSDKIDSMIDVYVDVTPEIVESMDLKDARACRADLNSISKELNNARKLVKAEYLKPLTEFENKIKALDVKIKAPCAIIDAAIKAREQYDRDARFAEMAEDYLTMAPALAEVVPAEKIIEKSWVTASFSRNKADKLLAEKVKALACDLETIETVNLSHPDETRRHFLDTLSVTSALQYDRQLKERDEEIARMDAMRASYSTPEPAPEPEPVNSVRWSIIATTTAEEYGMVRNYLDSIGISYSAVRSN